MAKNWIWLPQNKYPEFQNTKFDGFTESDNVKYVVAEFVKKYDFEKNISDVAITFSADTEVQLFCNGKLIATGPSVVGGDFFGNGKAREWYYADEASFVENGNSLDFFVRVKMCPIRICEYSKGHGGLMLDAKVTFTDGSSEMIGTDDSWLVRKNGAYISNSSYDGRIVPDQYCNAQIIPDIWNAKLSPIPVRTEREIQIGKITLKPHETLSQEFEIDLIYAGFIHLLSNACGTIRVSLEMRENAGESHYDTQNVILKDADEYRSFNLESASHFTASITNESDSDATVDIGFITTCYPVEVEAETVTSDKELNDILSVCKHTLKYCRQTHHLDSPRHCEPLACTGDYYIESLMTAFSFGDMRLAEFDIERTAELLRHSDGRMFHTTYSLIWARMLYDVYMFSGNIKMLSDCRDALDMLLARFDSYIGSNQLIENPPDYMFVDWIYIDGLSMHHPPKALGQTVLNMFYYMALNYSEKIYAVLEDKDAALRCREKKMALQSAVNALLYDSEKGMYFEGLNTPVPAESIYQWQPENVSKRYYLKHSNILAAYTSICDEDTARSLIEKVMNDEIEGDVQPYFQHYLLEAIYTHGLKEKYTLSVIERWKKAVQECSKGLTEGFYAPEPTYSFDHSHAWGGTPLYSLPEALTGLTIEEAGYRKIRLSPSLLTLEHAKIEIPTPYGMITCEMKRGEMPRIEAPSEITIVMQM